MSPKSKITVIIVLIILIVLLVFGLIVHIGMQHKNEEPHSDEPMNSCTTQDAEKEDYSEGSTDETSIVKDPDTDKGTQDYTSEESTTETDAPSKEETSETQLDETESNETEPPKMPDKGDQGTDWI